MDKLVGWNQIQASKVVPSGFAKPTSFEFPRLAALKPVLVLGLLCLWVASMGFAGTASTVTVAFDENDVNAWSGGTDIA